MFNGIYISIVKPSEMRYSTVGDWELVRAGRSDSLRITVADTGNTSYNMLIAVHEVVESFLCWINHITGEMVDKWDFEHPNDDEPGEVTGCIYYWEHNTASIVERIVALAMNISWELYEDAVTKTAEEVDKHVPAHKIHPKS